MIFHKALLFDLSKAFDDIDHGDISHNCIKFITHWFEIWSLRENYHNKDKFFMKKRQEDKDFSVRAHIFKGEAKI